MGWGITAAILLLLALLPVGVRLLYNEEGFSLFLLAGALPVKLIPSDKKKEKKGDTSQKKQKKSGNTTGNAQNPQKKKSGGSVTDFLPMLETVMDMLGAFRRKLRVRVLKLRLILGGADPADLAQNYGKAWAVLGNLMPQLERFLVIRKRDLEVECDFTADGTTVYARMDLTITVGRALSWGVGYGVRLLLQFFKIMNKRKGGANL